MTRAFPFFTKLLIWALLLGGGFAAYEAHRFLTSPGSAEPRDVVISIAPGATFDRVAWDLKKAGAITDVPRFRLLAQFKDALGKVRAGEFMVNTGWTPEQVLIQITEGRSLLYRLFVREGLTWWETARTVEEQGFATYEDFKTVIHDPAFLAEHNIPFANAEGFLFPETYLLKKPREPLDRKQARIVASAMVRMFWKKTEPLWKTLPLRTDKAAVTPALKPGAMQSPSPESAAVLSPGTDQAGPLLAPVLPSKEARAIPDQAALPLIPERALTEATAQAAPAKETSVPRAGGVVAAEPFPAGHEAPATPIPQNRGEPLSPADVDPQALRHLVILASLVEKETGVPSERGLVAGVYTNRLRLGMLLQCDPTIIYGIGENFSGAIRRSQLNDPQNLYNTYQHPGLPPGPICSSGFDALRAAAIPEQHSYLYFVATGTDGGHTFSKTLTEHNRAVQVYRSRMREKN